MALPLIVLVLALANWYARPAAAWAWTAVIAIALIMIVVTRLSQSRSNQSPGDAVLARSADSIASAVVFAALMLIIPLALTLARAYGLVDNPADGIQRTTMILIGAYLAMTGNAMPRMNPPTSSKGCSGGRIQAFQRLAGWTWMLCGFGFATAWLALPIDAAGPVSTTLVGTAMLVTIVGIWRLRKPRPHAPA